MGAKKLKFETREDWLQEAITYIEKDLFKPAGYKLPKVRVSCGLPYSRGSKTTIGEHWAPTTAGDKVGSIFISPIIDDSVEVLSTLTHELVHASVGNDAGHGAKFRKCALAVGLEGKMRSAGADKETQSYFESDIIKVLGRYPHSRLNINKRPKKKQSTRMIKMSCGDCEYIVRASATAISTNGPVICPCNEEPMNIEEKDE